MRKFSDFGIKVPDNNMFDVPKVSIADILNCEIEVIDFHTNVTTIHGAGRYVVKIKYNGTECKFFTDSDRIKQILDMIPKDGFPFTTTIKQKKVGDRNARIYSFT